MAGSRYPRRRFLRQALAVCALPSAAGASGPGPGSQGVRLGVRGPFPEGDLSARAGLLSRLGYQGIELGPEFLDQTADQILEQLGGTGISVSAIVGSIKLLDPDPEVRSAAIDLDRERLELARQLGAMGLIEVPTFGPCRFGQGTDTGIEDANPRRRPPEAGARCQPDRREDPAGAPDAKGDPLHEPPEPRRQDHRGRGRARLRAALRLLPHADGRGRHRQDSRAIRSPHRLRPHGGRREEDRARVPPLRLQAWLQGPQGATGIPAGSPWSRGATDSPEAALARAREYVLAQWNEA